MSYEQILEAIQGNECIEVIREGNDVTLSKNNKGLWRVKTLMGTLLYNDEELSKEIEEWENVIDIF